MTLPRNLQFTLITELETATYQTALDHERYDISELHLRIMF
jgi:hypothetical protein